ncbi:MAG: RNA polymerase sigma factor, partial [Acidimicrobiales bacterium]
MAASTAPHHTCAPDAHLVTHSLAGDHTAFEELFRRHAHPAWRLALAVTGTRPEAAEAVADGFARTFQRAHRDGAPPASFRAALARATRQAALAGRKPPAGETPGADDIDGLLAVFAGLPERWRSALWLTDVEGGTAAQTGMVLALSPEATSALADRARTGLRERFLDSARRSTTSADCRRALDDLDSGDAHVSDCSDCQAKVVALADLRGALRPLVAT